MFNFFKRDKSFKITKELLPFIPPKQNKDPLTLAYFREGDRIVICKNCKKVHSLDTWKYLKKCVTCGSDELSKELVLVEQPIIIAGTEKEIERPNKTEETTIEKKNTYEINITIRITQTNEDVDVSLPLNATIEDVIETLIENNLLEKNIGKYKVISKSEGVELQYEKTFENYNIQDGDTIIISPHFESDFYLSIKDKIANVPNEVLKQGPAYIEEYLKRLKGNELYEDSQALDECKLIFVGSGAVGKTSLIKKVVFNGFNEDEKKTDGIEITKWSIKANNKNVKLNIWDFGGQEIMHATHKFFMTRRSIYVLVINPRTQDQYSGEFELNYWLKLINSFAGNSPVIITINKSDIHKMDIGKGTLIDSFPQIIGVIETSCKSGLGINGLTSLIKKSVQKLKHLDDVIPLEYLKVKEKLEMTNSDYISYHEYIKLCNQISPSLTDKDIEILISLLNDLGVMLNISNNRRLADTQVLNPEWITNGVYSIINSPLLVENKGIINETEISDILDSNLYPTFREKGFIMDMMAHFELCYQIPDRNFTYFIPGAFPKDKPVSFRWEYEQYLSFQLIYDVLPNSIISRFLVKVHSNIKESNYWRNGAIIQENENIALVEAIPFEKKIIIKVAGTADKRELLSSIRKDLSSIHRSISKIRVESYISLNDEGTLLISYNDLLSYEQEGIEFYFEPKQKKKYSVKKLLYGVEKRIDLNDLKRLISKGKIDEVLNNLNSIFPNSNELILLLSRYNKLKSENMSGVIDDNSFRKEENNIALATLQIIDEFQKEHGSQQSIAVKMP